MHCFFLIIRGGGTGRPVKPGRLWPSRTGVNAGTCYVAARSASLEERIVKSNEI